MTGNTYTWTCPRCKFRETGGSPSAPSNCPRCNFPDDPTAPVPNDPNAELEADVGPEGTWTPPDFGGVDGESVVQPPWPPPLAPIGQTPFTDRGWLADCMREIVAPYLSQTLIRKRADGDDPDPAALDWDGVAGGVADRYEGPRPTLLCGCFAGKHPKSIEAMAEAHPERMT